MGRLRCSEKLGLKKGPWTPEEDRKLVAYIQEHGHGSWPTLPAKAGLQRCGKSCRLRWINYLSPEIKRGDFSSREEQTIIQLHALIGNRWSTIAAHLPKRTDNEIKNYWNFHIKKKLMRMGIDPITHRPKTNGPIGSIAAASNLSHVVQWENTRLEAEARLASKLGSSSSQPPDRLIIGKIQARPSLPPCLDVLRACQSSSTKPVSPKGNNIMHSMYAMMLTAADDLESPTSTLSFARSKLPISTAVGQLNDNILSLTTTPAAATAAVVDYTKSSAACDDRMMREAIDNNSLLMKETLDAGINEKGLGNTTPSLKDDHDIMVSVEEEAFTAARYENVLEELSNNAMECPSNDMAIYHLNEINLAEENLGIANEINHWYWNSILNMVDDFECGSPLL